MTRFADAAQKVRDWIRRMPAQSRGILMTTVCAAAAALVVVTFQVGIRLIHRGGLVQAARLAPEWFLPLSAVLVIGGALLAGWLLQRYAPQAAGSGIPQLKHAFWRDFGHVPFRVVWVKFVVGVLQIGTGTSLGREGPSVQIGGAVGSGVLGSLGTAKQARRAGAAAGAAAALAAAFNTPLAAVTFVLEELVGDLNSRLLGRILLASMVGVLVAHGLLGPEPAFLLPRLGEPTWRAYGLMPAVAAGAALVGVGFQKAALGLRGVMSHWGFLPRWVRPACGAALCWAIGAWVFLDTGRLGVFGLGYEDLSAALDGRVEWQLAALLLATKFIATVACYGTGGCGGIFAPTLFFGAMVGLTVAGAARTFLAVTPEGMELLAVVGMSATLGAVVRAPVTSILIVFEMTHEFALVPPLMLGALVSQAIARRLARRNFYDEVLVQDGHDVERFAPPRDLRAWQSQPVRALANMKPVFVDSLEPQRIATFLDRHPHSRYPVVLDGRLRGVLTRDEGLAAVAEARNAVLVTAVTCGIDEPVVAAGARMVESTTGMLVIADAAGKPVGILTLHDILRAQMLALEEGVPSR